LSAPILPTTERGCSFCWSSWRCPRTRSTSRESDRPVLLSASEAVMPSRLRLVVGLIAAQSSVSPARIARRLLPVFPSRAVAAPFSCLHTRRYKEQRLNQLESLSLHALLFSFSLELLAHSQPDSGESRFDRTGFLITTSFHGCVSLSSYRRMPLANSPAVSLTGSKHSALFIQRDRLNFCVSLLPMRRFPDRGAAGGRERGRSALLRRLHRAGAGSLLRVWFPFIARLCLVLCPVAR
jgi:hypothetical protein